MTDALSNDNTVVLLELLQPNKTDVLAYLNGDSEPPERWARVVIDQGTTDPAVYAIYAVATTPSLTCFGVRLLRTVGGTATSEQIY